MTGRLEGKVAFITGAARGQGRAHAIRMAEEGADIIAVDICRQIDSNVYALAQPQDLSETERAVKERGRRIVARQGDVRERSELKEVLHAGLRDLGRLDIVVANAGICPIGNDVPGVNDFVDVSDVNLLGVMNTVAAALVHLSDHGSIVITGSAVALASRSSIGDEPGAEGYAWSKQTLVSYSEQMALHLASRFIRVNVIHPGNCNTAMIHHETLYRRFRPDLENPSREEAEEAFTQFQAMPIPYVEPEDVANMAVFLASDEARYVTGQQITLDAGCLLKHPGGRQG